MPEHLRDNPFDGDGRVVGWAGVVLCLGHGQPSLDGFVDAMIMTQSGYE